MPWLIRPDGYVGWVGDLTHPGLPDALTTWFGPPTATWRAAFEDLEEASGRCRPTLASGPARRSRRFPFRVNRALFHGRCAARAPHP
jgi:hypothetical protein